MNRTGGGRPGHLWAVAAGVAIAVAVALFAFGDDGGGDGDATSKTSDGELVLGATGSRPAPDARDEASVAPSPTQRRARRRVRNALDVGVEQAAALGGSVHVAAMVSGWSQPVVAASESGEADRAMRLWSISKVVTAVALLRGAGWGERPGKALSPEVEDALEGALVRSENCRQRRVVLELQEAAGGPARARSELDAIVGSAGAEIEIGREVELPQPICRPFLATQHEPADAMADALLLGTSTWTMADAATFVHGLASGEHGAALGDRVLELMRRPKRQSRETPPGDYTAALDWGAGRALATFRPAYKAGWGGSLIDDFFVSQVAALELPNGEVASLAVAFHPDIQPPKDDPGLTPGPDAVEEVMRAVGDELGRLGG